MKLGEIIEVICGLFLVVFIAIPAAFMLAFYYYIKAIVTGEKKRDDEALEEFRKKYVK